jgi:hypothetical protein
MGYEAIERYRKEVEETAATCEQLAGAVKSLKANLVKISEDQKRLQEEWKSIVLGGYELVNRLSKYEKFNNVVELNDLRLFLRSAPGGPGLVPEPDLDAIGRKIRPTLLGDAEAMYFARIAKLRAAMPKVLKPGMVLVDKQMKKHYEIKSGPKKSPNSKLTGDEALLYEVVVHDDKGKLSAQQYSAEELKGPGMKYLKGT